MILTAALITTTALFCGDTGAAAPPSEASQRRMELAICLDTSGSMEGLIEAAKQKLWAIVNDLATADPVPELRVALLTFGNDGHPAEEGWVRVDSPFTTDLDRISEALFALTTNGGTEYVGRVLDRARGLEWTAGDDVLKIAIVAGNESADQDQEVPFREVCPRLIEQGVIVNAIYCGPATDEIAPGWREVARLADGRFASIDKDQGTVVIETPFDEQLSDLSAQLNGTYLWFGEAGAAACSNQLRQDKNAAGLNKAAAAQRAQTKAGGVYWNRNDLVWACRNDAVKLEEMRDEELPEGLRGKTLEEKKALIDQKAKERAEVEQRIRELAKQRQKFVAAEMKKRALGEDKAFDSAVRAFVREQAVSRGFRFAD